MITFIPHNCSAGGRAFYYTHSADGKQGIVELSDLSTVTD